MGDVWSLFHFLEDVLDRYDELEDDERKKLSECYHTEDNHCTACGVAIL